MANPTNKKFLEKLAKKVLAGKATDAERLFLLEYYKAFDKEPDMADTLSAREIDTLKNEIKGSLLRHVDAFPSLIVPFYRRRSFRVYAATAAAAVLILMIGAVYLFKKEPLSASAKDRRVILQDMPAGGNKAVLTLGNGNRIILTGAKNGDLAEENNTVIHKTADGEIVYEGAAGDKTALVYNTMSTPRGGQYHLVLADGTQVWLNAASSIRYPTAFAGDTRTVEITGEAYFEVSHDPARPFLVTSKGQIVRVLGTHFNISAYADEPETRTTLLEGSVKISAGGKGGYEETAIVLKPGEQSRTDAVTPPGAATPKIRVKQVNVNEAIAWHKDLFVFNDEDLKSILRKVSRWYDMDVIYNNDLPDIRLYGVVSRTKPVSAVLHALEGTSNLEFKLEKGKIIVMPKY